MTIVKYADVFTWHARINVSTRYNRVYVFYKSLNFTLLIAKIILNFLGIQILN